MVTKFKTFDDIKFENYPSNLFPGVVSQTFFDNGYGVSVSRNSNTYGYMQNLYELAVTDNEGNVIYGDCNLTEDVHGWLTPEDVTKLMEEVQRLPKIN